MQQAIYEQRLLTARWHSLLNCALILSTDTKLVCVQTRLKKTECEGVDRIDSEDGKGRGVEKDDEQGRRVGDA